MMKKHQHFYVSILCISSLLLWTTCKKPVTPDCPDAPPTTEDFIQTHIYNTGKGFRTTTVADLYVNAYEQAVQDCELALQNNPNLTEEEKSQCDSLKQIQSQSLSNLKDILEKIERIGKLKPPPECPKGIWEDFGLLKYMEVVNPPWSVISISVTNPKNGELLAANVPNKITTTKDGQFSLIELQQFGDLPKGGNVVINVQSYNSQTKQMDKANLRIVVQ